jgi:hypothetical protein
MLAATLACCPSCTPFAFTNDTAALSSGTPGTRGNITVQFINNTPFRAIFTYGTYDPQDSTSQPEFGQFFASADPTQRLEGNTISDPITFTVGRQVSIGGVRLLQLINDNNLTADEAALQQGITFSNSPLDSPDANSPTAGRAPPNEAYIGDDYQFDSLIVYTFSVDPDQPSGFLIERTVILP